MQSLLRVGIQVDWFWEMFFTLSINEKCLKRSVLIDKVISLHFFFYAISLTKGSTGWVFVDKIQNMKQLIIYFLSLRGRDSFFLELSCKEEGVVHQLNYTPQKKDKNINKKTFLTIKQTQNIVIRNNHQKNKTYCSLWRTEGSKIT